MPGNFPAADKSFGVCIVNYSMSETNETGKAKNAHVVSSVYPGSRNPDPEFYPSRIPEPGFKNSNKREGWKKLVVILFCSHKFHKIENYFIFEMLNKKFSANFQRIIELFTQKIVTKLSKIWFWDPGSQIRDPGVKKALDPGSGSASATLVVRIGSTHPPLSPSG
jgi:hypothetical protein